MQVQARPELEGIGGQGDKGRERGSRGDKETRGQGERQRGKEIQGREDPGIQNTDPKIQGGVGPSGI